MATNRIPGRRVVSYLSLTAIGLWLAAPSLAGRRPEPVPVRLVVVPGLTAEALNEPSRRHLRSLAREGAVGLLAMPVRVTWDEASALLSLSSGVPVRAGVPPHQIVFSDEIIEGAEARYVLARRMLVRAPEGRQLINLGSAALHRSGLHEKLLGERLSQAGAPQSIAVVVGPNSNQEDRFAAFMAMNASGVAPLSTDDRAQVIVERVSPNDSALEERLGALRRHMERRLWVVGVPLGYQGNGFAVPPALTVLTGPGIRQGVLTSNTTRTPGLISFTDVSATLMHWITGQSTITGKPVTVLPGRPHLDRVTALARLSWANTDAMVPVLFFSGLVALVAIVRGMLALVRPAPAVQSAFRLLHGITTLPVAFLLAGRVVELMPARVWWEVYVLLVTVLALLLAGLYRLVQRPAWSRHNWNIVTCVPLLVTAFAIFLDGITGQAFIRSSILAACGLSGIRFYGVGNEYMSILVGSALGCLFLLRVKPVHALVAGAALTTFFGIGTVGANGGGLITACCGCGLTAALLTGQRRLILRSAMLLPCAALALALAFAELDARLFGPGASHLGGALTTARVAGIGELVDVAVRKFFMNLGILTSQPVLISVAALAILASYAGTRLRDELIDLQTKCPQWTLWRPAAVYTAGVAFVFNDTGVIAALFIAGIWGLAGLYLALLQRMHLSPAD